MKNLSILLIIIFIGGYMIEIIEMDKDNAIEYAKVSSKSWLESYKDIIDLDYLKSINTVEYFSNQEKNLINRLNDGSKRYLIKEDKNYVGIFRIRPTKYAGYEDSIELGALYLLNSVKGKGYGRTIFNFVIDKVKDNYNKIIIGCLEDNHTNSFYINMGCRFIFKIPIIIGNKELMENVYLYDIGGKNEA